MSTQLAGALRSRAICARTCETYSSVSHVRRVDGCRHCRSCHVRQAAARNAQPQCARKVAAADHQPILRHAREQLCTLEPIAILELAMLLEVRLRLHPSTPLWPPLGNAEQRLRADGRRRWSWPLRANGTPPKTSLPAPTLGARRRGAQQPTPCHPQAVSSEAVRRNPKRSGAVVLVGCVLSGFRAGGTSSESDPTNSSHFGRCSTAIVHLPCARTVAHELNSDLSNANSSNHSPRRTDRNCTCDMPARSRFGAASVGSGGSRWRCRAVATGAPSSQR